MNPLNSDPSGTHFITTFSRYSPWIWNKGTPMPHTIKYNPETRMIESWTYGEFTLDEVREALAEFAVLIKEHGCSLMLNDYHDAIPKFTAAEIYSMPAIIAEIFASHGISVHQLKRAFVTTREIRGFLFFETVTVNQGQNTRVFHEINEARNWLLMK